MFCQCQERHLNFARVYSYNYRRFPSYFPSSLFCRLEKKKNISFCCLLRNLTLWFFFLRSTLWIVLDESNSRINNLSFIYYVKVEADLLYFLEKLNYKEKRDYCIKKISKFQFNRNYTLLNVCTWSQNLAFNCLFGECMLEE